MKVLLLMVLLTSYNVFANENVIRDIKKIETQLGIPSGAFEAIIKMESTFNHKAINTNAPIRSYGVGQLTLDTGKDCGLNIKTIMNYMPNLLCSARLFKNKLKRYNNDLHKAVVAYNQGTPCICEDGLYKINLGRTRITCIDRIIIKGKEFKKPRTCDQEGKLFETKYLRDFLIAYNN